MEHVRKDQNVDLHIKEKLFNTKNFVNTIELDFVGKVPLVLIPMICNLNHASISF